MPILLELPPHSKPFASLHHKCGHTRANQFHKKNLKVAQVPPTNGVQKSEQIGLGKAKALPRYWERYQKLLEKKKKKTKSKDLVFKWVMTEN